MKHFENDTVVREVTPGVWTFSKPFTRYGILPIGGRSTVIKLSTQTDGKDDLWILASTPLTLETKTKVDELGVPKYLISPDSDHHLFLGEWKRVYPAAKLIGPAVVAAKKPELKFDGVYGKDPEETHYGFEDEIEARYFSGFIKEDIAFLHKPSKTLLEADLIFNQPCTEQYSIVGGSGPFFGATFTPYTKQAKKLLWKGVKKDGFDAMAVDSIAVSGWDFERIIPCHGDVIENDAKEAWNEAFKWHMQGKD
ncbi:uncharacterized protein EI90DRAFT_3282056 [Cantharellus anzutake]|uniref:uncharacterized protein n=1 Tax=Cantharellus anzutake TaxID=1750568 RepID=UPI0019043500|nr:uncharacterized protein EI90DRAFT_3282056 [Cantharellus anzutake]KAF8324307.1 hypothetical protein EI90DRAFT_3282056 [Cantharellus anzutake]